LDECHAPEDAPDPADDDDEGGELEQADDDVDGERASLGLDSRRRAAVEHAERRHQRPWTYNVNNQQSPGTDMPNSHRQPDTTRRSCLCRVRPRA